MRKLLFIVTTKHFATGISLKLPCSPPILQYSDIVLANNRGFADPDKLGKQFKTRDLLSVKVCQCFIFHKNYQ